MNAPKSSSFVPKSPIFSQSTSRTNTHTKSFKFINSNHSPISEIPSNINFKLTQSPRFLHTKPNLHSSQHPNSQSSLSQSNVNFCDITFGNHQQRKPNLKFLQSRPQMKVPRFIRERQLAKSEQNNQKVLKGLDFQSHLFSSVGKQEHVQSVKSIQDPWFGRMKEELSFEVDDEESFGSMILEKNMTSTTNSSPKIALDQFSILQSFPAPKTQTQNSFKSTQSIETSASQQNIPVPNEQQSNKKSTVLSNLSNEEQQEIENDFKELFSSRRVETYLELFEMNEELGMELEMILN